MDLPNTLLTLARDPQLVAWRDSGTAIAVTPNLCVIRIFIPKPYRWYPGFADIVASDWQIGSVEKLRQSIQAQLEQDANQ